MNGDFIWAAVGAYFLVNLIISLWAARRIRTEKDYLVAGRSLGLPLVAVSLFATWFGAETVIGSSAAVSQEGLAGGRADPFGYALTLLGMGVFLAYRMRAKGYVTLGDFFRERYNRTAELVGSALFIPSVVTWGAAQLLALAQILVVLTGTGFQTALAASAGVAVLYTWLGGLLGSVLTNAFQTVMILIGLTVLLIAVVAGLGGAAPALASIEPSQLRLVAPDETLLARIDLWAVPILGSLVSQAAFARIFAARSAAVARKACFAAFGIYLTVGLVPVTVALLAPHLGLTLGTGDTFLPALAQDILPPVLFVVFMGALVSVVLSTVVGTFLTVASLASHNIVLPMVAARASAAGKEGLSERAKVRLTRIVVALSGGAAYLIALGGDNILALVIFADSLGTAGLLIAVLIGLYLPRLGGPAAALAAFAAGLLGYPAAVYLLDFDAPFLFSVGAALTAYGVMAVLVRHRPQPDSA